MDLLIKLANFYNQNQDVIQLLIAFVIYVVTHKQVATSYAKKKAITVIFAAEKWAEDLMLQSGGQKMDFVVQKAYAKLPAFVRMVISLENFRSLAQKVFDDAASLVKEHQPTKAAEPSKIITDITQ